LQVINSFKRTVEKDIVVKFLKRRNGDFAISYADNSKLLKKISFKPKFSNIDKIVNDSFLFENKLLNKKK